LQAVFIKDSATFDGRLSSRLRRQILRDNAMPVHFLPLLFAKLAGKLVAKKAVAHRGAHHALGRKIAKETAERAVDSAIQKRKKRDQVL